MLHAKIEQIGIDTQNEVVKEEKRQRYDNQPYGQLLPKTMEAAYKEHPLPVDAHRLHGALDAATHADFMDFYETFYVPENATLSIAGDLNVDEAKELVEAYCRHPTRRDGTSTSRHCGAPAHRRSP